LQNSISRIDGHVHYAWPVRLESLWETLRQTDADAVCLLALPGTSRLDPTPDTLCAKLRRPETTFVFGCLDCTVYEHDSEHCGRQFVRRVKRLLRMGCDGVKLLEGKPTMRRAFPIPDFDAPAWEPFWAFAERIRLPILWHVNDPEQFWDPAAVTAYAKSCGWGYGEGDVNNEAQYAQVRAVLERHPRLNVTFAHMFFLSANLSRLGEWLERFPNMRVDLTPGIELYETLSKKPEETREFFARFADRIQLGTDIGGRTVLKETPDAFDAVDCLRRAEIIRFFLQGEGEQTIAEDGHYLIGSRPFTLRGLALPEERLQKIERENFLAFVGRERPRRVNTFALRRGVKRLMRTLRRRAAEQGETPDLRACEWALDDRKRK